MTPEERLDRIVELLATASLRLFWKGKIETEQKQSTPISDFESEEKLIPKPRKPGPVPFGVVVENGIRFINSTDQVIIERIRLLSTTGQSSEQIANILNMEDKESKRAGKWTRVAVWRILKDKSLPAFQINLKHNKRKFG